MNIPKWEKPLWADLTPDKVRNMSETQIRSMLKQALEQVKSIPDSNPSKKYMLELGQIALKMNKNGIKIEKGVSDEEKELLQDECMKLHEKAVEILSKVIKLQKDPLAFIDKIVEIQEEHFEDPWGESYSAPEPEVLNVVNQDFDPWAVANEF